MFGSEEQKREWLPKVARDHVSAFLLTEPDVGSDPARMSDHRRPDRGRHGYRINGTKLWATNGAIADVVVIMAVVPKTRGQQGRHHRLHLPVRRRRHHGRGTATSFMGLRGIENSVTALRGRLRAQART